MLARRLDPTAPTPDRVITLGEANDRLAEIAAEVEATFEPALPLPPAHNAVIGREG